MKAVKFRAFLVIGMLSLCMSNFTSVTAMDADNMFAMYDAYDDVDDRLMSYSPSTDRDSDSYDHSNDVSMNSGVTDKDSDSSEDNSNDISMNDDSDYTDDFVDKAWNLIPHVGGLYRSVSNLQPMDTVTIGSYDKNIDPSKEYNQRFIDRMEKIRGIIEAEDRREKGFSLFDRLENKNLYNEYNFYLKGDVDENAQEPEFKARLTVYVNPDAVEDKDEAIVENVNNIIAELIDTYGIEVVDASFK